MQTVKTVLSECMFPFFESNSTNICTIKAVMPNVDMHVTNTFLPDIVRCRVVFKTDKYNSRNAKQYANTILAMAGVITSPTLKVSDSDKPIDLEWLMEVTNKYSVSVLLNITSNYPRNVRDNDVL